MTQRLALLLGRALLLGMGLVAAGDAAAREPGPPTPHAPGLVAVDRHTLKAEKNLLSDHAPLNPDGTINVVVEIPAGTTAKWEVAKPSGELRWELEEGRPRVVRYLGYPGNYGMLPRTLLARQEGADGDPLDALVLGAAVARGSVVRARVIGVLRLLDGGERDDKILAVLDGDPLAEARSIRDLDERFPGVTKIVEIWFESYKGPGRLESQGFAGPEAGRKIVEAAAAAYAR
ncbi:MAG: inorganic diphosphatase [Myxococcota bacterium]|nr:inorganic diphosphatase [Myxococcota bacterium]